MTLDYRVSNHSLVNRTLTGLSNGSHMLYVTVMTERDWVSTITYFSINQTTPPTPLSTAQTQTTIQMAKTDDSSILKNSLIIIIAPASIALVVVLTALV